MKNEERDDTRTCILNVPSTEYDSVSDLHVTLHHEDECALCFELAVFIVLILLIIYIVWSFAAS